MEAQQHQASPERVLIRDLPPGSFCCSVIGPSGGRVKRGPTNARIKGQRDIEEPDRIHAHMPSQRSNWTHQRDRSITAITYPL